MTDPSPDQAQHPAPPIISTQVLALLLLSLRVPNLRINNLPPLPPLHQLLALIPQPNLEPVGETPQIRRYQVRAPRQHDVPTLPTQHLLDDPLRHSLRMQTRRHEVVVAMEALEQRRLCETLRYENRAHLRGRIPRFELRGQPLVEGQRGGLGGGIVDHVWRRDVRGEGRDGHDDTVVRSSHGGDEFTGEVVVGDGVDVEGEADVGFGATEDGLAAGDAGVVD
jgi:hypothetical protein